MRNRLFTVHSMPPADNQDDVFALSHIFALVKIRYADIHLQEQLPDILSRWPLLAEFVDNNGPFGPSPLAAASDKTE